MDFFILILMAFNNPENLSYKTRGLNALRWRWGGWIFRELCVRTNNAAVKGDMSQRVNWTWFSDFIQYSVTSFMFLSQIQDPSLERKSFFVVSLYGILCFDHSGNLLGPSPWVTKPWYPFPLSLQYVTLWKMFIQTPKFELLITSVSSLFSTLVYTHIK